MLDLKYTVDLLPTVASSLYATLMMTVVGLIIALMLGLVLALLKVVKPMGLHRLADLYISFFRGTPLLVQLFLFYYGLPQIFHVMTEMPATAVVMIGLGLHFAAYTHWISSCY